MTCRHENKIKITFSSNRDYNFCYEINERTVKNKRPPESLGFNKGDSSELDICLSCKKVLNMGNFETLKHTLSFFKDKFGEDVVNKHRELIQEMYIDGCEKDQIEEEIENQL